jgi:hypothetical protein
MQIPIRDISGTYPSLFLTKQTYRLLIEFEELGSRSSVQTEALLSEYLIFSKHQNVYFKLPLPPLSLAYPSRPYPHPYHTHPLHNAYSPPPPPRSHPTPPSRKHPLPSPKKPLPLPRLPLKNLRPLFHNLPRHLTDTGNLVPSNRLRAPLPPRGEILFAAPDPRLRRAVLPEQRLSRATFRKRLEPAAETLA